MLKNFTIKNYKSIKEFEIKKLNRVNLFIGRNNAGKSNILEAILLYATRFNLNSITQINSQRTERAISPRLIERGMLTTLCLPLAPHRSITSLRKGIELKSGQDSILLQQVKVIPMVREERLIHNYRPFQPDEEGHGVPRVGIPTKAEMQYFKITYEPSTKIPCIYVNCAYRQISKWKEYWENLVLANNKGSLINALQIVDPKIEDVDIIINRGINNQFTPYVKIDGKYFPLFSMGDGLVHIFNIMLALVNTKGGILLLDEMENGLHIRTLEKLWSVVNDLSKLWNIQVFVTTHSNDCIRAFSENSREEGTLYMLNHQNGELSYNTKGFRVVAKMLADDADLRNYTDDENIEKRE